MPEGSKGLLPEVMITDPHHSAPAASPAENGQWHGQTRIHTLITFRADTAGETPGDLLLHICSESPIQTSLKFPSRASTESFEA